MNENQIKLRNAIVNAVQAPLDRERMFALIRASYFALRPAEGGLTWSEVHDIMDAAYEICHLDAELQTTLDEVNLIISENSDDPS
jgi:hypothetical protein